MATKTQKAKKLPPAQSRSPVLLAMMGTMLNMAASAATVGSVWLCLVVAKHLT
jgi:hypothetical protein